MNKLFHILLIIFLFSCSDSKWDGELGATVGDCDEICTVYYTAQQKLESTRKINNLEFPNKKERRKHVVKTKDGHRIESWFYIINNNDTTINQFSCEVFYDNASIKYIAKNFKFETKEFLVDGVN